MRRSALFRWLTACLIAAALFPAYAARLQVVPGDDVELGQGFAAYEAGDLARALQLFRSAAERNQRVAQFNLAVMLMNGEGGP
ncbi:MAG TPA: sel1 repeat family protein, partial [Burkholderiaceae bacterium]|nr:sel1 repeat family protein [Burkholderiaceae bacterium]